MSPFTLGAVALSMSVDAFIASIGKGAATERATFSKALRTGLIFGSIEAVTPLIGWSLGKAAGPFVAAIDHWIAFVLLAGVGLHMLWASYHGNDTKESTAALGTWALVVTAIGTSIDAMAVGVSMAFLDVNILVFATAVGIATVAASATGVLAGKALGERFGRRIEVLGGMALIGLGVAILIDHLGGG